MSNATRTSKNILKLVDGDDYLCVNFADDAITLIQKTCGDREQAFISLADAPIFLAALAPNTSPVQIGLKGGDETRIYRKDGITIAQRGWLDEEIIRIYLTEEEAVQIVAAISAALAEKK